MKAKFWSLIFMLALLVGGMMNSAIAEATKTAEFNGGTYTMTVKFICGDSGNTGCGKEIQCNWKSFSIQSDDGSKITFSLNITGACSCGKTREYNASASAVRTSDTEASAAGTITGSNAKIMFAIYAPSNHVHDWQYNNNGTHSCANGCGKVNIICTYAAASTCKTAQACTFCGGQWKDPNRHEGETELRNVTVPTCVGRGYSGNLYCLTCDRVASFGESLEKDPQNHAGPFETLDVIAATCHTPGNTGDTYCYGCDSIASRGVDTPYDPSNHSGATEIRDAKTSTCHEKGYTGDTWCLGCETIKTPGTEIAIAPANHDGETEIRDVKPATMREEGYTGDVWCLGCETIIEKGQPIDRLPMQYYVMNACSIGPRLRDVSSVTDRWFMFTPIDISADGVQTFDLIAGDMHVIGKVVVTVAEGMVTVTYEYYSLEAWTAEEFLTLLPNAAAITEEALTESAFAFGQPISIAEALGGDTQVLLAIRNEVNYPLDIMAKPFRADEAYEQLVEDMMLLLD